MVSFLLNVKIIDTDDANQIKAIIAQLIKDFKTFLSYFYANEDSMLSQTVEYALRAVVYLSRQEGKPKTIQQIAEPTQIPPGYLAKVLMGLARDGILTSQRGYGGGFTLAIPADKLTMYDVVQAVDPLPRIRKCPLDNPDHALELCDLHKRLDQAAQFVEENFKAVTIAEVSTKTVFTQSPPPSEKE